MSANWKPRFLRLAAASHTLAAIWLPPITTLPLAIGFWLASRDPRGQKPLLVAAIAAEALAFHVFNAVWIIPLLLLWRVIDADSHGVESAVRGAGIGSLRGLFEGHRTEDGIPLSRIVNNTPSLLVFLRHAGCPFCKQALADLAAAKPELDRRGVRIILVHHSSEGSIRPVPGISVASDAERRLYRKFGLMRGNLLRILGPTAFAQGMLAVLRDRHGIGLFDGDLFQMPGMFLVHGDDILASYYHRVAGDRPDYAAFVLRNINSFQPQ
ncbi:MAG: AhpC/TSA family protein [Acidobacteria bacterium]|nr:AhpC/TSA family protein [Acidobacteriota bacterium]